MEKLLKTYDALLHFAGTHVFSSIKVFAKLATMLLILTSCASNDVYENPMQNRSPASESRANPAAYVTDIFPVNRPLPQHEKGPQVDFYFKRCNMSGDHWPISATSYDCTYP